MTTRKVGGYAYRYELTRAMRASEEARKTTRKIIEEKPGNGRLMTLAAELAGALLSLGEALGELEKIVGEHD